MFCKRCNSKAVYYVEEIINGKLHYSCFMCNNCLKTFFSQLPKEEQNILGLKYNVFIIAKQQFKFVFR